MVVRLTGGKEAALTGGSTHPFTDVDGWGEPYVAYAYANGITTGVSDTTFGFHSTITQEEYLTLLLRAMDYTDVADDAAYAEAVRWVSGEGYMGGYGNGAFGPEDAVSREQLVTVLWRYVGSPMLMDYPGLTQFDDVGEIARFAQSAFAWAHQKGYIAAVEDGKLAPQSAADQELAGTIFKEVAARK